MNPTIPVQTLTHWLTTHGDAASRQQLEALAHAICAALEGQHEALESWARAPDQVALNHDAVLIAANALCHALVDTQAMSSRDRAVLLQRGCDITMTLANLLSPQSPEGTHDPVDFESLLASLKEVIYSAAPDGTLHFASASIEDMTGLKVSAIRNDRRLAATLILPEDRYQLDRLKQRLLVEHGPSEESHRIRHARTGQIRHVLHRAIPVLVEGQVERIDGVLVDITERRELERRLGRIDHLRSLGQLAGGVAHDFNNLLMSILGYTDLLLARRSAGDPDIKALELIANAAERGAALTRQLLSFARGAKAQEKRPVHLLHLIRETVALVTPSVQGVQVSVVEAEDIPVVIADAAQIGEAVLNLALNAAQACAEAEHGSVQVQIRRANSDEAQSLGQEHACVIVIEDDGPGMPADVVERIFEPLFTTRSSQGGTGLGCAMAYGIVMDHGGSLHVRSKPGQGSRFTLILPAAPEGTTPARTGARKALLTPAAGHHPARHVLVADDEESVRGLLSELLNNAGYEVTSVCSGNAAIASVRARPHRYDLAILDVMMADGDGTTAYTALSQLSPQLPIIFCTGQSRAAGAHMPQALQQVPVIHKPFRAFELLEQIETLLNHPKDLAP